MFEHLMKQYQNLVPILGIVAVLLMLTLGVLTALGRKKAMARKAASSAPEADQPEKVSVQTAGATHQEISESIVVTKLTAAPKVATVSYSVEEIVIEPSEEELAIAEAIAQAGAAASSSEIQQAQISFADTDRSSWRQAIKESLQRRMQRASDRQQVLALFVMAPRSSRYQGSTLIEVLEAEGLALNDKQVFQMKEADGANFYVASAVNPGTFDLDLIDNFTTPGLSFILDLAAVPSPKQAFTKMLHIVSNVAEQLGGDVLDEHRQRLTQAGINEYIAQIKSIEMLRKRNDYA
jgi:cell division protein ZipA